MHVHPVANGALCMCIVQVDLDLPAPDGVMDAKKVGRPDPATLGTMIESWLDLQGKLRVGTRANVKNFSDAIGHSLDYQVRHAPSAVRPPTVCRPAPPPLLHRRAAC